MRHLVLGLAALGMATPAMAAVYSDDFSTPGTFSSDYEYTTPDSGNNTTAAQYTVATDAYPWNGNFASYGDHTTGGGNYMVVNGAGTVANVYQNAVPLLLTGGASYAFSFALSDACCNTGFNNGVDPSPPVLGLTLSQALLELRAPSPALGVPLSDSTQLASFALPANTPAGQWQVLSTNFTAPSTGLYFFALTNLNTESAGNDFGLDDISISSAVPEPASWAMMIGGFGLVGGAMRRRGASRTAVRFA